MHVLTLMNTAVVLAHPNDGDFPGGWDSGWWWVLRPLMLLIWIVVTALVVRWVLRSRGRREPTGMERAREILAERYARGEVSLEEYQERIARLS
ncbi:MAG: hypothetical protein H0T49_00775 [Chloroflexia bacterium]|nr:hypothetical protein [Chloroflexia bacterium]